MSDKQRKSVRVGIYWCNDFSGGSCSADTPLDRADDRARGFARAMQAQGHTWAFEFDSSTASPTEFLSFPNTAGVDFDNDQLGVDSVDFAYLDTHGAMELTVRQGAVWSTLHQLNPRSVPPSGNRYYFAAAFGRDATLPPPEAFWQHIGKDWGYKSSRCVWWNSKSKLGDRSLRWLVVDTCESLQLPGYNERLGLSLNVDPEKMWRHAFYGINMVFGFTGYTTDSSWNSDRGARFGRRVGRGERMADAWIEEAYSVWMDEYPVALACGRTEEEAWARLRDDRVTEPKPSIPRPTCFVYLKCR